MRTRGSVTPSWSIFANMEIETVGRRSDEEETKRETCEEDDKVFDVFDSHEFSLVLDEERHAGCVDYMRAEVEDAVPISEEKEEWLPDELSNLQRKNIDEETEEPVEGDIRERNVTIGEVVGEFRKLLGKEVREDTLIHAHPKLHEKIFKGIRARR